jgi:hypothetical protein
MAKPIKTGIPDPERNIAVNSATDPQRPRSSSRKPAGKDAHPPGTTAAETTVPTDTATATHEPGPEKGPEDRGPGRGGVE